MALRQQHMKVLESEHRKRDEKELVHDFFDDAHHDAARHPHGGTEPSGHQKEHMLETLMKSKLAFDPPEESRHTAAPDRLDAAARQAMLLRADGLASRAAQVSVKEATSLEQRRAKEEAAYASFEELHAQQEEIHLMKHKLELDTRDSNYGQIHTLLFGPKPDDCSAFGDWDVYEKVQQQIRKFAYVRSSTDDATSTTTVKLQDRLLNARSQMDAQRLRIKELSLSLRSSVHEISSLKALLSEKNDELSQTKQKTLFLQAQLKHVKESHNLPQSRRQNSVPRDMGAQQSSSNDELLQDFQQLVGANLQLEQENILLRARVSARGLDTKELRALLPSSQAEVHVADVADRNRRRRMLNTILPTSSAVLRLRETRKCLMRRQECVANDALGAHDSDAGIQLMKRPPMDGRKRTQAPQKAAQSRGSVGSDSTMSTSLGRSERMEHQVGQVGENGDSSVQSALGGPIAPNVSAPTSPQSPALNDAPISPLWQLLRVRLLAGVAVSRADSHRREVLHVTKLRHRLALLHEENAQVVCDRDSATQRCEKLEHELIETKSMLQDVVSRCEVLSATLENSEERVHLPTAEDGSVRLHAIAGRTEARRRRVPDPVDGTVATIGGGGSDAHCRLLEAKLAQYADVMNDKVASLEDALSDTQYQLHVALVKLDRGGVFYSADTLTDHLATTGAAESTPTAKPSFQQRRLEEEMMENALGARSEEVGDDPQEPLRIPNQAGRQPDDNDRNAKTLMYERELADFSSKIQVQARAIAISNTCLAAAQDEIASMRAERAIGIPQSVAYYVAPRLRRALGRARERLQLSSQTLSIGQASPASASALPTEEDEEVIGRLLSLVEEQSAAYGIISCQRDRVRRAGVARTGTVSTNHGASSASSHAMSELRSQWLKLLIVREKQLKHCSATTKQTMSDLVRQTYEDAIACEQACSRSNDDILVQAAHRFVEWHAAPETRDPLIDLADVRSSEQLQRERLALNGLKHAYLQLARDIEVKKSEITASEGGDPARSLETGQKDTAGVPGVYCRHTCRSGERLANVYASYGVLLHTAPNDANLDLSPVDMKRPMIIPLQSATTAKTIADSFQNVEFIIRYVVQCGDTMGSIAARFSTLFDAIHALHEHSESIGDVPEMPRVVDIHSDFEGVLAALAHDPSSTQVLARIVVASNMTERALSRCLNVDESALRFFNKFCEEGSKVAVPLQLSPTTAPYLRHWIESSIVVIRLHIDSRQETVQSVALRFGVSDSNVLGRVAEGEVLHVVIDKVDAFLRIFPAPSLEHALQQPAPQTVVVEVPTPLSTLAAQSNVSRFHLRVPNLDGHSKFLKSQRVAPTNSIEHLVRCRTLDHVRFAAEHNKPLIVAARSGVFRPCHDAPDALAAVRTGEFDTIFAIVALDHWSVKDASKVLNADPCDVLPWELDVSPALTPTIAVYQEPPCAPQYDEWVVSVALLLSPLGKTVSPTQVDDILRGLQQDVLEIVAFACNDIGALKRCEVPFVDPATCHLRIQVFTTNYDTAVAVQNLISKDGAVSELNHVTTVLLDLGLNIDSPLLLTIVDPPLVRPSSSAVSYHSVSGDDSMLSLALHYGVRVASLIEANATTWYQKQLTTVNRRARRNIKFDQPGDTDTVQTAEERPLRQLQIRVIRIPATEPLSTIRFLTMRATKSLTQVASMVQSNVARLFVNPSSLSLNVGSVVRVPPHPSRRFMGLRGGSTSFSANVAQHVIEGRGDTLDAVSQQHDVAGRLLLLENPSLVQVPYSAIVAVEERYHAQVTYVIEHTISEDDTLHGISMRYGVAPQDVLSQNPFLRSLPICDAIVVPAEPDDAEAILECGFSNVLTFVPEIPGGSIAKTFGCTSDAVAVLNRSLGTIVPGRSAAPVSSPVATALARRQQLTIMTLLGVNANDTVTSVSDRCACHINDILYIHGAWPDARGCPHLRIAVSRDAAMRHAGTTTALCFVENAPESITSEHCRRVGPRVVTLSSREDVLHVEERLHARDQRHARFAQRLHNLDDRLVDVAAKMASVQSNLNIIENVIVKQRAAGTYNEPEAVAVNRENVFTQTDVVVEIVPIAEQLANVRVPVHTRLTQTNLTGDAVEETLFSISDAHGKEVLLETELEEVRQEVSHVRRLLEDAQRERNTAMEALALSEVEILSFRKLASVTQSANVLSARSSLSQPSMVVEEPTKVDAQTSTDAQECAPSNVLGQHAVAVSNDARRSHDFGAQVGPILVPMMTQTTSAKSNEPNAVPETGTRVVRVTHPSTRDNELAPKDSNTAMVIAFTDIQSSTTLWARAPDAMSDAVELHHQLIRKLLRAHGGYEVKTIGDCFMVAFVSAQRAIEFAIELQRSLFRLTWPTQINEIYADLAMEAMALQSRVVEAERTAPDIHLWNGLRVRVGMNFGTCSVRLDSVTGGYDYYGTLVNTAARVEGIGNGGQTLATEPFLEALRETSTDWSTMEVEPLGAQSLRGLDNLIEIYQLSPKELCGRRFGALRIEKANELSDEALSASITHASAVSEAQRRALDAEEIALRAAAVAELAEEALMAERNHSMALLFEHKNSKRDDRRTADAPLVDMLQTSSIGSPVRSVYRPLEYVSRATSAPALLKVCSAGTMTDHQEPMPCPSRMVVTHSSTAVSRSAVRQALETFWNSMQPLIAEQANVFLSAVQQRFEAAIVQNVSRAANDISHDLQMAIVRERVGQDDRQPQTQALTDDQSFAVQELLRHTSSPTAAPQSQRSLKVNENDGNLHESEPLPPLKIPTAPKRRESPAPMRRSIVSKIVENDPPPALAPNAEALNDEVAPYDSRTDSVAMRNDTMRTTLTKSLLKRDASDTVEAPFSPPFAPQVGTLVAGIPVSLNAQEELRRVRDKVHRDVLSVLRLDLDFTAARPASTNPVVDTIRSLNGALKPPEVEAVRHFRDEQKAVKQAKMRLLLQRIGTQYRAKKLLGAMTNNAMSTQWVHTLWDRWHDAMRARHSRLLAKERFNVATLVAAFSAPSIPSGHRGAPSEYAPFHITHYESTKRRTGASGIAPMSPPQTTVEPTPSSLHFRFARFQ